MHNVSSLTPDKVRIFSDRVEKKVIGGSNEYFAAIAFSGKMRNDIIDGYSIKVARAIDYKNDNNQPITVMEYISGDNLEELIEKGGEARNFYIKLMGNLFHSCLKKGILHLDFAPRNLIIDNEDMSLGIIDFERGILHIEDLNIDEKKFVFSFSIFEELSAFLSLAEISEYFLDLSTINLDNIRESKVNKFLNNIGTRRSEVLKKLTSNHNGLFEDSIELLFEINKQMALLLSGEVGDGKNRIESIENLPFNQKIITLIAKVLKAKLLLSTDLPFAVGDYFYDDHLGIQYFSENGKGFPRSGLDVYKYLISDGFLQKFSGRHIHIVDIGTGEIGFLANSIAAKLEDARVTGVELNEQAFTNATRNKHSSNLDFCFGNVYSGKNNAIDLFISNPPQMPILLDGSLHDSGGKDGLDVLEKIFIAIKNNISITGTTLLINLFDFLGIESTLGRERSVFSLLEKYQGNIVNIKKIKRYVRSGGETEKNMSYIKELSPEFELEYDENGKPYHYMFILEICFK